ncbi:hypothetical protein KSW81_005226 [Nannochloris sp. 'desiccata']|nr:hypothetical protein KSW81_005226 [Chlorella desiccata (nom. nud.)]
MATSRAKQEKEDPARPPSKEDVIVSLKFDDQSDLIYHMDSGGGIVQNEEGDEFVEIQEEWDADGNVISTGARGGNDGGAAAISSALRDTKIDHEEDSLGEPEEVEFDDDAFESMMQEMEELELAAAEEQSPAAALGKTEKTSKPSAKSPAASASPGIKRGFLLPRGEQKPSNKADEKETSTTGAPTTTTPAAAASRPMAFTGAVVERQPATATSRLPSAINSCIDSLQEQPAPQRVSKFKQRMYGDGSY